MSNRDSPGSSGSSALKRDSRTASCPRISEGASSEAGSGDGGVGVGGGGGGGGGEDDENKLASRRPSSPKNLEEAGATAKPRRSRALSIAPAVASLIASATAKRRPSREPQFMTVSPMFSTRSNQWSQAPFSRSARHSIDIRNLPTYLARHRQSVVGTRLFESFLEAKAPLQTIMHGEETSGDGASGTGTGTGGGSVAGEGGGSGRGDEASGGGSDRRGSRATGGTENGTETSASKKDVKEKKDRRKDRKKSFGGERSEDDEPEAPTLSLGERVAWIRSKGPEFGTVRWIGRMPKICASWTIGIEFDNAIGSGDGRLDGRRYFTAKENFARFLPLTSLTRVDNYAGRPRSGTLLSRMSVQLKPGQLISVQRTPSTTDLPIHCALNAPHHIDHDVHEPNMNHCLCNNCNHPCAHLCKTKKPKGRKTDMAHMCHFSQKPHNKLCCGGEELLYSLGNHPMELLNGGGDDSAGSSGGGGRTGAGRRKNNPAGRSRRSRRRSSLSSKRLSDPRQRSQSRSRRSKDQKQQPPSSSFTPPLVMMMNSLPPIDGTVPPASATSVSASKNVSEKSSRHHHGPSSGSNTYHQATAVDAYHKKHHYLAAPPSYSNYQHHQQRSRHSRTHRNASKSTASSSIAPSYPALPAPAIPHAGSGSGGCGVDPSHRLDRDVVPSNSFALCKMKQKFGSMSSIPSTVSAGEAYIARGALTDESDLDARSDEPVVIEDDYDFDDDMCSNILRSGGHRHRKRNRRGLRSLVSCLMPKMSSSLSNSSRKKKLKKSIHSSSFRYDDYRKRLHREMTAVAGRYALNCGSKHSHLSHKHGSSTTPELTTATPSVHCSHCYYHAHSHHHQTSSSSHQHHQHSSSHHSQNSHHPSSHDSHQSRSNHTNHHHTHHLNHRSSSNRASSVPSSPTHLPASYQIHSDESHDHICRSSDDENYNSTHKNDNRNNHHRHQHHRHRHQSSSQHDRIPRNDSPSNTGQLDSRAGGGEDSTSQHSSGHNSPKFNISKMTTSTRIESPECNTSRSDELLHPSPPCSPSTMAPLIPVEDTSESTCSHDVRTFHHNTSNNNNHYEVSTNRKYESNHRETSPSSPIKCCTSDRKYHDCNCAKSVSRSDEYERDLLTGMQNGELIASSSSSSSSSSNKNSFKSSGQMMTTQSDIEITPRSPSSHLQPTSDQHQNDPHLSMPSTSASTSTSSYYTAAQQTPTNDPSQHSPRRRRKGPAPAPPHQPSTSITSNNTHPSCSTSCSTPSTSQQQQQQNSLGSASTLASSTFVQSSLSNANLCKSSTGSLVSTVSSNESRNQSHSSAGMNTGMNASDSGTCNTLSRKRSIKSKPAPSPPSSTSHTISSDSRSHSHHCQLTRSFSEQKQLNVKDHLQTVPSFSSELNLKEASLRAVRTGNVPLGSEELEEPIDLTEEDSLVITYQELSTVDIYHYKYISSDLISSLSEAATKSSSISKEVPQVPQDAKDSNGLISLRDVSVQVNIGIKEQAAVKP